MKEFIVCVALTGMSFIPLIVMFKFPHLFV